MKKTPVMIAGTALLTLALCGGCAAMPPVQPGAGATAYAPAPWPDAPTASQETYDDATESPFVDVLTSPLSTFASDVDTASYSNLRRQLTQGVRPQGVRIEELVNYFDYHYPAPVPGAAAPFTVTTQVADCPWAPGHQLAMIGVQATRAIPTSLGNNIVFLIDVSGSMSAANKLPLVRQSFNLLIDTLGESDVVSIVTYAGSNQTVADSVPGSEHDKLHRIVDALRPGGSTGGAAGLAAAYALASKNFIEGGNNRVILATDGDFNVGPSSDAEMKAMIEQARNTGVFITVLGFGTGNLKDSKMETIADYGNGNYAYIDTLAEARKVLVNEFNATMFVVAQDLKLQVEFNGATVAQYRLIGYDNRRLADADFANDAKDAGDVGAGHSVTAFYELVPADGTAEPTHGTYGTTTYGDSTDFFTVSVRYKAPGGTQSILFQTPATAAAYTTAPSADFRFAAAVAEFGLLVTGSQYAGDASLGSVSTRASAALGDDPYGLRGEFLELVDLYSRMG